MPAIKVFLKRRVVTHAVVFSVAVLLLVISSERALAQTQRNTTTLPQAPTSNLRAPSEGTGSGEPNVSLDRIKQLWRLMHERMIKAIQQQENLITRIESRIAKLDAEGKNTVAAKRSTADAKTKLASVKTALASLEAKVAGLDASTNKRQLVQSIMQDVKTIKLQLIEVHKSIQAAIRELKALSGNADATRSANQIRQVQGVAR